MRKVDIANRKGRMLYLVFLAGLAAMYATYVPCLMDYYLIRSKQSYFSFFYDNHLAAPYHFEGIIIGMAFAMIYCVTLKAGISTLVLSVFLFILTHASYMKYINRRELLRLDDLRLTEAAGMAFGYFRVELNDWFVMLAGILVLFSGAGFVLDWFGRKMRKEKEGGGDAAKESRLRRHHRIAVCVRALGAAGLCAALFLYTDYFLAERYEIDVIEPLFPENDRYVLYRFLQNDSLSGINVERVEESYDFLLSQEPAKEFGGREEYPNVIVIMNESWWNTDNIKADGISFSRDPMEPYKKLADRCSTGYVTSAVFGGGTVTPEIEFLTGLNAKYYRADSAYEQMQGRRIPSVVDYFNGLDYETVAIHPYYGEFYSRDSAYASMGFDKVIFEDNMRYKEIYTRYISDESLVKQIIAEAEEENGVPKFIWALSIANHINVLDYAAEPAADFDYPIQLTAGGAELAAEDYETLVSYVNGIYLANEAFAQLVDYFSSVGQPTVILMFGDHCPYFSKDVRKALGIGEEEGDGKATELLYSTPVILWSNFPHEELSFSGESMYYLPLALIEYAGLPDCDMTRILRCERAYFKTNSPQIVRDASGEEVHQCTMEQLRALSHYKVVQYDILHGEAIGADVWQPIYRRF